MESSLIFKKRKINETKRQFFGKINKTDKSLAQLIRKKKRRHKLLVSGIKKFTDHITIKSTDIKRTIRGYYNDIINNCMPILLTTYMKQANSLKDLN